MIIIIKFRSNVWWIGLWRSLIDDVAFLFALFHNLIIRWRFFILIFPMAYLAFLYFFDLALVLRAGAVTNHFPDPSIFTFDSEDVVSILSRLSNFSENFKISYIFSYAFKVTRSSLSLISLCFLKLRLPQFLVFTGSNKSCFLPVNISSQNVFRVEQPW